MHLLTKKVVGNKNLFENESDLKWNQLVIVIKIQSSYQFQSSQRFLINLSHVKIFTMNEENYYRQY